jgi:hypothetical protein
MLKPRAGYEVILVETYFEKGNGVHAGLHVRNIPGSTFKKVMRVRFPKKVRDAHKEGTRFWVYARLVPGDAPFLHTNHAWEFKRVTAGPSAKRPPRRFPASKSSKR